MPFRQDCARALSSHDTLRLKLNHFAEIMKQNANHENHTAPINNI